MSEILKNPAIKKAYGRASVPSIEPRKPCIVQLITGLGVGGAERLLLTVVEELQHSYEIFVVAMCGSGRVGEQIASLGIEVTSLQMKSFADPVALSRLFRLLKMRRPDILHTHLFRANLWGRIVGRLARVPIIIASEHSLTATHFEGRQRTRFMDKIESTSARLNDCVIAVSEATRSYQLNNGIHSSRIVVIPNAIKCEDFEGHCEKSVRRELGIADDTKIVTCVGRLHPQKGHDFLLRAHADVLQSHPRTRLLIVGDGPRLSELKELVARLGVEHSVHFLGTRSDVGRIFAASDIVVLSSLWEPFGIALLEAMAAGRPVVASRVDGVPEVVQEGVTGMLVRAGNSDELAAGISRLLEDETYALALGKRGQGFVKQNFDIKTHCALLSRTYEKYLEDERVEIAR